MHSLPSVYLGYLVVSIAMTVWVARTLHRNGRAFLVDAFGGNEHLADSVNHLLVVGFYLINLGWVSLMLRSPSAPQTTAQAMELLSRKLGWVLLILGGMHFLNVFVFSRMRSNGLLTVAAPPVRPEVE